MIFTEEQQAERANLVKNLKYEEAQVLKRQQQLAEFDEDPKNNVFATLDDAYELEHVLRDRAHADCEGSYSCGQPEYIQGFYVGDKEYEATAKVEYNRHDKTYYYIDGFDFSFKEVTA